jgi:4-diphosphocytidyl-2-C-methyl-D-erythritol kinase
MLVFPNAKINIGLNVVSRRSDGYHNLETFFYPIPLCDILEFIPAQKTDLTIIGTPISGNIESNLVMRAYQLLRNNFKLPNLSICLQKKIPMGAGLGGGSSDAAFMLKALNTYFDLQLSELQLENYAAQLGADCPFFIRNAPTLATGIGNEFTPINISLTDWYIILVKPNIHISTAEAYAHVSPSPWEIPLKEALHSPIQKWQQTIQNDFENSCFSAYPILPKIKQRLYDAGAVYAAMSGSGSTMYGLFKDEPKTTKLNMNEITDTCFCLKLN